MELLYIDEIISACEAFMLKVGMTNIADFAREGIKNV